MLWGGQGVAGEGLAHVVGVEVLFVFVVEGRGVTEPSRPVSCNIAML